jgi:hypothetical protein
MSADQNSFYAGDIPSLKFGARFSTAAFTVAMGIFNIGVCCYLPIFSRVFMAALPGQTLPSLTTFILRFRIAWIIVALLLPISAVGFAFVLRNIRTALIAVSLIAMVIALQDTLTWMSLIPPMIAPLGDPSTSSAK